jgi:serine/threonine protein kinase
VGREVAVKMIRPELASQASFVRRFEAEARTIARLGHPHIVPLVDFWRDSESAYLVMALMAGGSVEEALASGSIESDQARRLLAQVGSALDHAHSLGIVHGDLRPANVLLDGSGNAYLTDFWIGDGMPHEIASSAPMSYRAPELEETGPTVDADRYAFGVLVGHLLDGGSELAALLARATAADPRDRYPSCASLLYEIDGVRGGVPQPPEKSPATRTRVFRRSEWRTRATSTAGRSWLPPSLKPWPGRG